MVAKITGGASVFGALKYNQDKVEKDKAKILATNKVLAMDKEGQPDISRMLQSFETYLKNNQKTEKPVIHISLNPHPEDQLTDEQLKEIAGEYMEKLGYGKQPYIVFKHSDIEREHIHIVSIRTDADGKKINDAFEYQHSKQITASLEKKYGLHPADKKQENNIQALKRVDPSRDDLKKQIGNIVKDVIKTYRFQSVSEYRVLLSLYGVTVEEIKGETPGGKLYNGLVYSALNDKGERAGNPFKSSLFGKSAGYEAMNKQIQKSEVILKSPEIKNRMKREISACMRTGNREDFEKQLQAKGINVVFRENEQGRIYGVTFVSHRDKIVLNGSKLGKEFSANSFNNLFTGSKEEKHQHQQSYPGIKPDFKQSQTEKFSPTKNEGSSFFDLFTGKAAPDDEKPMKAQKKKRKSKRIR